MNKLVKSVKGTRDFYPEEMAKRQWLIEKIRQTSELFGYEAYDGPCLEMIDLYAAKSGEELVKEQAFVFPDRSGELIALRPELTPTLARMVASRQNELTFPLRWWSLAPSGAMNARKRAQPGVFPVEYRPHRCRRCGGGCGAHCGGSPVFQECGAARRPSAYLGQ